MQNPEEERGAEHRKGAEETLARAQQRVSRRDRRIHDHALHHTEAEQKHQPLKNVVGPLAGFYVSNQEVERDQYASAAQDVHVSRGPGHRKRQRSICRPEDGGEESGDARIRNPPGQRRNQREIGYLRQEDPEAGGKRIRAEHTSRQQEQTLAQRAERAINRRPKNSVQEIVPVSDPEPLTEPDEVVLLI